MLIGFPFASLVPASPVYALFQNLFFLDWLATLLTTVVAIALGWGLVLTARVVLLNGELRFSVVQMIMNKNFPRWIWWIPPALAAPVVIGTLLNCNGGTELWHNILAVLAGAFLAYLLGYGSFWLAIRTSPAGCQPDPSTIPGPRFLKEWLVKANHRAGLPEWLAGALVWCGQRLPPDLRTGYLDDRSHFPDGSGNPGFRLPWASHWLELSFALLTFALYFLIGAYKMSHLGDTTSLPALALVLFLLLNLNWVLSFLTFLLDRFRIPLVVPVLLFAVIGTYFPSSDSYYQIHSGVPLAPIHPFEALEQRAVLQKGPSHKPIIVVATAGGGIQAAAWTVQVLSGLEHESQKWDHGDFADSVALISSVSGGATGSMFFLNEYGQGRDHPGFQLQDRRGNFANLLNLASAPAIDDIAWALVYRDLPGVIIPGSASGENALLDRGRMLELAWQQRTRNFSDLSAWRSGVKEGWRPAAIFNATIAETGEPFLLCTTDFDRGIAPGINPVEKRANRRTFYELYPGADVPIVTAVRLAASFPFVSPAARAQTLAPEYHIIDGGYYDNYGVASAAEWLDEAFAAMDDRHTDPPDVLFIQIRSFPNDPLPAPQYRGWFFQAHAPLTGLLSVRTSAQLVRDRDDLRRLQSLWWGQGKEPRIRFAGFQFTALNAPLSWEMNQSQIDEVRTTWDQLVKGNGDDLEQVHCAFDPSGARCAELAVEKGPW